MTRYGHLIPDWNQAKDEAKAILQDVARTEGTISYSDLAAKISAVTFEADDCGFHAFLGEISMEEDDAGHGLMTVLVVHKDGDKMPGPGWFQLAEERGRDVSALLRCWIAELKVVYAAWKR